MEQGQDELLTVKAVASLLKVDGATVRRWIKTGLLEAVVLPSLGRHSYRIWRSALNKIIN